MFRSCLFMGNIFTHDVLNRNIIIPITSRGTVHQPNNKQLCSHFGPSPAPPPNGNYIVHGGGSSSCQLNKLIFTGCQIDCSFESWFIISCIRCINCATHPLIPIFPLKYNNIFFNFGDDDNRCPFPTITDKSIFVLTIIIRVCIKTKCRHITNIMNYDLQYRFYFRNTFS